VYSNTKFVVRCVVSLGY